MLFRTVVGVFLFHSQPHKSDAFIFVAVWHQSTPFSKKWDDDPDYQFQGTAQPYSTYPLLLRLNICAHCRVCCLKQSRPRLKKAPSTTSAKRFDWRQDPWSLRAVGSISWSRNRWSPRPWHSGWGFNFEGWLIKLWLLVITEVERDSVYVDVYWMYI